MYCILITKRECWIDFLHEKKEQTRTRVFSELDKRKMKAVKHSQAEVREIIVAIITTPNKSWSKQKKHNKYAIPQNYFGQYA